MIRNLKHSNKTFFDIKFRFQFPMKLLAEVKAFLSAMMEKRSLPQFLKKQVKHSRTFEIIVLVLMTRSQFHQQIGTQEQAIDYSTHQLSQYDLQWSTSKHIVHGKLGVICFTSIRTEIVLHVLG